MADVAVQDQGTICLVYPKSARAEEWIEENVEVAFQFGDAVVVEHRFIEDILTGMKLDGLEIVPA